MSWENYVDDLDAIAHRHMRAEALAKEDARRPPRQDLDSDDYFDRMDARRGHCPENAAARDA